MKYLILVVAIICAVPCSGQKASEFSKVEWINGAWSRTNAKPGKSGQEYWTRSTGSVWTGLGVTMQGQDTAFIEKLKIITDGDAIYYVADVAENKTPVRFKFTELSDTHFVCENPNHDFPKKISYRKEGEKLHAVISGNGKSIDYWFERKK